MSFKDSVTEYQIEVNGINLCYFEWGVEYRDHGPTVLFTHAGGFHARMWDPIIRGLQGYHIIAVDLRGHGRSEETLLDHWEVFGEDLSSLIAKLDLDRITGVGHSLGGYALTEATARHEDRFEHLILIDPAIVSPDQYHQSSSSTEASSPETHPATKRKSHFESPQAMIDRFKDRKPYSRFTVESLHNYCHYGLRKDSKGYRLACSPLMEATVYLTSKSSDKIFDSIRKLQLPVLIIRAQEPSEDNPIQNFSASPTWIPLVNEFRNGRELHYPEQSHFLPMEIPDEISARIAEVVQS